MNVIVKKIRKPYFEEIINGNKTFELRKEDDTKYNEGDILILKEIDPFTVDFYTGRIAISKIGFVLRHYEGLSDDYAIISLKDTQFCDLSTGEEE